MKEAAGSIEFIINTIPNNIDFQPYIACVAKAGKFIQVGMPAATDSMTFNINSLVLNEIEIMGSCVGPRKPIKKMVDYCHRNDIYPIVEEYPFEKLPEAFEKLEHDWPFFRCVVNMKGFAEKNGLKK